MKGIDFKRLMQRIPDGAEVVGVEVARGVVGFAVLDGDDTIVDMFPIEHSKAIAEFNRKIEWRESQKIN